MLRTQSAISAALKRKCAGDHWSNFWDNSRTAAPPRAAMSPSIPSTV